MFLTFLTCIYWKCSLVVMHNMLFYEQVIAVGPGPLDEEGKRQALSASPGSTVLYSKYAGNDFKGTDGANYIALRASDVMAILS